MSDVGDTGDTIVTHFSICLPIFYVDYEKLLAVNLVSPVSPYGFISCKSFILKYLYGDTMVTRWADGDTNSVTLKCHHPHPPPHG